MLSIFKLVEWNKNFKKISLIQEERKFKVTSINTCFLKNVFYITNFQLFLNENFSLNSFLLFKKPLWKNSLLKKTK